MDFVSPVLDIAFRSWDCTSNRALYIRELSENLDSLRNEMEQLNSVCLDVKEKVEREEKLHKKRTHAVEGWIKSVEAMGKQVDDLLAKGDEQVQKKCLGTCCPKNCRASYKIGKMVCAKMEDVASKKAEALDFNVVAEPLPHPPPMIERPLDETVGLDSFYNHVCMQLQDEKVTRVGLYGMGGVGKTTHLNRINNEFLKSRGVELDVAIWVTVSRPANVEKVQRVLFNKLNIPDHKWEGRSEDERKEEIFNVLKSKKFVLLLDDVWEPLDLLQVGIPPLCDGNKSKVVLTTRFSTVCRDMRAKAMEVKRLAGEDAFTLFRKYVGEDTIHSHPHIPKLAEIAAKECDGLPLALTVIGRAMAGAKTPEEWEKKIQMLKNYPEKFPGMEKHLFSRLAFSYDSLQNETIKLCFLYCSLFPEDYKIPQVELIELWIGEGFLDEYSGIKEARDGGEEVIASLKHACLLEGGDFVDFVRANPLYIQGRHVKMHDVVRDTALWLACEDGRINMQHKFVVVDKSELVNAQEVEKWKAAQRIPIFHTGFEEPMISTPSFSNLQTLIFERGGAHGIHLGLPSGIFKYMPNIKVLKLTIGNTLEYLPEEIDKLLTLQYLDLSSTLIKEIPEGLGNLERLRCLKLDGMLGIRNFPCGIISCLSSLQLFSFRGYNPNMEGVTGMREELEGLKCSEEVSMFLYSGLSIHRILNSRKLQGWLRLLDVGRCNKEDGIRLFLFPNLEELWINFCDKLEAVVVNGEEGVEYSKFPRHHQSLMFQLSCLRITCCWNLKKLTCLVYARNLKFLLIGECGSLEEVIQAEEKDDDVFSRLSQLYLIGLRNLRSICRWNLLFPSLRVMYVRGCRRLRKLPFDSSITRRRSHMQLQEICGRQRWWDRLEWEDQYILPHLTPHFKPVSWPYTNRKGIWEFQKIDVFDIR